MPSSVQLASAARRALSLCFLLLSGPTPTSSSRRNCFDLERKKLASTPPSVPSGSCDAKLLRLPVPRSAHEESVSDWPRYSGRILYRSRTCAIPRATSSADCDQNVSPSFFTCLRILYWSSHRLDLCNPATQNALQIVSAPFRSHRTWR
jgi:hypothetical protein